MRKKSATPKTTRPTTYSRAVADRICEMLMAGRSLRSICAEEGMPAKSTVLHWVQRRAEFAEKYKQALRIRLELYAEEIVELADLADDKDQNLQALKLKIDARKWAAARLMAKRPAENEGAAPAPAPDKPAAQVVVLLPENFRDKGDA